MLVTVGESALSHTYSKISERYGNRRKIYVKCPRVDSKPTFLIYGTGHSSDECKVLGYSGSNYVKSRPTKYDGHDPVPRDKFYRKKENNSIVNSAV